MSLLLQEYVKQTQRLARLNSNSLAQVVPISKKFFANHPGINTKKSPRLLKRGLLRRVEGRLLPSASASDQGSSTESKRNHAGWLRNSLDALIDSTN